MTAVYNAPQRRSRRLSGVLPVFVCGETSQRKAFREEALAITFNAHGALLVLYEKVELGQRLRLMNPTTWDEQEARIVYSSSSYGGLATIGVEFITPAPMFWPINDPPTDWRASEREVSAV